MKVPFGTITITQKSKDLIKEILDSNRVTSGKYVRQFEERFAELVEQIKKVVGFHGELVFAKTKPNGMPVKILDNQKLKNLGWKPMWSFEDALKITYAWFKKQKKINGKLEREL